MTKRFLLTITAIFFFAFGSMCISPVHAEERKNASSRLDILPIKLHEYESAKRAARRTPNDITTQKQVIASYLEVAAIRIASLDVMIRKLNTASNDEFFDIITNDRAELSNIAEALNSSQTPRDLANITKRIKSLRIMADRSLTRSQVLATHKSVLIAKGIMVLENRMTQIRGAMDILAKGGKDITALEVMFEAIQQHIESAKMRMETLSNDRLADPAQYEENKAELLAIEGEIRIIYQELDALSQKGRLLRDTNK